MNNKKIFRNQTIVLGIISICILSGCYNPVMDKKSETVEVKNETSVESNKSYGVFLGANPDDLMYNYDNDYDIIVIDAQEFSKQDITKLKSNGTTVYSYLNIGSIENYRPYYSKYEKYTLDVYENWEDEKWVDVSEPKWQSFILDDLAPSILDKGVDGLFIDNVDVYYHYQDEPVFEGLTNILTGLKEKGTYILINGGDIYVHDYFDAYDNISDIMDGVNQETVFSAIDWDNDSFKESSMEDRKYFMYYVKNVATEGLDVYLLEYTDDENLKKQIVDYCENNNFYYYISDDLYLPAPNSTERK